MRLKLPAIGESRMVVKWALWPLDIGGYRIWFERYREWQHYCGSDGWIWVSRRIGVTGDGTSEKN